MIQLKNILLVIATFSILIGCNQSNQVEVDIPSELPRDILGHEITFYNQSVTSNPDNLNISEYSVYWMSAPNELRGEGDDGIIHAAEGWSWSGGNPGDSFDTGTLILDYGTNNGTERFVLSWNGEYENVERRQSYTGYYNLAGAQTVVVEGFYEIDFRGIENSSENGGDDGGNDGENLTSDLTVYSEKDHGCGDISVTVSGVGSGTVTGYYDSPPNCGANFGANFL